MKNKKAEKLLSIWWFFVLGVIAGGIVIGVLIYSSADINVNSVEAGILNQRILDCIIENGYLVDLDNFNIFNECNLDVNSFQKNSDFYFNISVYNENGINQPLIFGDSSFEAECRIQKKTEMKKAPSCASVEEIALNDNGEKLKVVVLSASYQQGKKGEFNE